jgi:hypothetical protein
MDFGKNKSILKQSLFWEMFIMLAVTGILNYVAVLYHLYWTLGEFDSVVHFCGGTAISFFFLWFYFYSGFFKPVKKNLLRFLTISILGTMFVSVSWEVYELILGEAVMQKSAYPFDTALDLTMDFLGTVAACFYAYLRNYES